MNKPKTYFNIHQWLRYNYQKPILCEHCKQEKKLDFALKKGMTYEKNRSNYLTLCRSCHAKYDVSLYKRERMIGNQLTSKPVIGIDENGDSFEFISASQASRYFDMKNLSAVSNSIYRNTKCGGLKWRYL